MFCIKDCFNKYASQIDRFDLELIISHILNKPREFVLAHPEYELNKSQLFLLTSYISRRSLREPLAYILGHKEFYGLDFLVNKNVLIPRPETEILVEHVISNLKLAIGKNKKITIADIGTGSGNIIISITKWMERSELPTLPTGRQVTNCQLLATDISKKALAVAKQNAKFHKVDKEIKFLRGNLLSPFIKSKSCLPRRRAGKLKAESLIIIANLPYLSPKIYKNTPKIVRNYEPKKALISQNSGLRHYEKLLKQIRKVNCQLSIVNCFFEHSPEQKPALQKLIKKYFPEAEIKFHKDLAGKWRVCGLKIQNPKLKCQIKSQIPNH